MDMNQYLDLFLEESMEHVQKLNQNLLNLEINENRLDLLDEIFRAAHTLKGMSATMGFEALTHLTHKMENVLEKVRKKKLVLDSALFDYLFQAVDVLESMLVGIRNGNEINRTASDEIAAALSMLENNTQPIKVNKQKKKEAQVAPIAELPGNGSIVEFNEFEKNLMQIAESKNFRVWEIKVGVDKACLMKGARAFMVFRNLEEIGEIIKSVPSAQDIEDEKFNGGFSVVFITPHDEIKIQEQIKIISEVTMEKVCEIKSLQETAHDDSNRNTEGKTAPDMQPEGSYAKQEGILGEKKQTVHQTVRVDIGRLDKLMSLVGELVINKTRLEQINISSQLTGLNETIEQINRITTDLQSVVQNVRMVSIEQVFNRFPRMVRDLARDLGKEVNLIMEGKETELDRTVIDEIGDPLVHLIRNAIDHGLEAPDERIAMNKKVEGTVLLAAKQEGNHVVITVEDDGRGIDIDAIRQKAVQKGFITPQKAAESDEQEIINLIFEPGFSTANQVTDISGRGVGMDVVKNKITALSGQVSLETKPGQGSRLIIKLPLTLAIIQALLVGIQNEKYAIPLGSISETTSLVAEQMKSIQDQPVMILREKVLPLAMLRNVLQVPGEKKEEEMYVVVVKRAEQQMGLVVDELIGQQEIVISSLGQYLGGLPGIAGASILGDGTISLILDVGTLL